jgi:hypothetical protein
MDETEFWILMEKARAESNGDINKQLDILTGALEQLPVSDIFQYQRVLDMLQDQAYTWDLWAACYILNGGCSDDGFDYFRGWLIAQGKDVYYNALRDPEILAELARPEDELDCEELLYIAWTAYEGKTGHEFPAALFPRLGHAEPSGEKWTEDELDQKYPRLVAASNN